MGRKKLTGKSEPVVDAPIPPQRLALSILEFCDAHGISEGFYYKLKKQRKGPREMKVGARTLISFESAAEWRRAREDPRRAPGSQAASAVPPIDRPCGSRGSRKNSPAPPMPPSVRGDPRSPVRQPMTENERPPRGEIRDGRGVIQGG
jgi:hypothetical protein